MHSNDEKDHYNRTINQIKCSYIPINKQKKPIYQYFEMKCDYDFIDSLSEIFERIHMFEG